MVGRERIEHSFPWDQIYSLAERPPSSDPGGNGGSDARPYGGEMDARFLCAPRTSRTSQPAFARPVIKSLIESKMAGVAGVEPAFTGLEAVVICRYTTLPRLLVPTS